MTLKNKILVFTSICFLFASLSANAASKKRGEYATKNIEGQDYYLKRCSQCHGEGNRGGNMASIDEWKQMFSKDAFELIDLHIDDEESQNVVKYIKSDMFNKEKEQMMKFLQEFAYDSDNIPTCN